MDESRDLYQDMISSHDKRPRTEGALPGHTREADGSDNGAVVPIDGTSEQPMPLLPHLPLVLLLLSCMVPAMAAGGGDADFHSGGAADASVSYLRNDGPYQTVDGCRFYRKVVPQQWRTKDDVIDGFDWSLPPGIRPSPGAFVKGAPSGEYPGNRIESINTTWREIEPEQGRYDFSGIARAVAKARQSGAVVELHVRASVWDIENRGADGKVAASTGPLSCEVSAPRWLQEIIPSAELTETRKPTPLNSRSLVNCDIFHPVYHRHYLRMVEALARSELPRRPEIKLVYIHMVSGTGGEENDGASIHDPVRGPVVRERIKAWVDAFGQDGRQFAFTGHIPENLEYCYKLGVGQRNGLVECYLLHTHNPILGQSMDADGHMLVDESLPPIARNLMFGDENEEYAMTGNLHVERFGPRRTWNHRYREATLRALQMRRNYIWEPYGTSIDPYLGAYLALALGRQVTDAPDAWCYLRESQVHAQNNGKNPPVPVKNFERWLVQRDLPGEPTEAVRKVMVKDYHPSGNIHNCYVPGQNHDFVARMGKRFGFALDDRFIVDANNPAAIKITYYDEQPWKLVYPTASGRRERAVACRGDGTLRTATLFVPDAVFTATGDAPDFEIRALDAAATIRFVRVVRATVPIAPATTGMAVGKLIASVSDEFNGDAPDPAKWNTSPPPWGAWTWKAENAFIKDGILHLQTVHAPHQRDGRQLFYTSGIAKSRAEVEYGYFGARIRGDPKIPGVSPAFWASGSQRAGSGKITAEIDFMEIEEVAGNVGQIDTNLHGLTPAGKAIHDRRHWIAPWDPRDDDREPWLAAPHVA